MAGMSRDMDKHVLPLTHLGQFYLFGLAGFKLALCMSYLRNGRRESRHSLSPFHNRGRSLFVGSSYRFRVLVHVRMCAGRQKLDIVHAVSTTNNTTKLSRIFDFNIEGSCLPFSTVNYVLCATVVTLDITIFLLPIPLVRRLRLDRTTKTGLIIVFALGLVTTVLSILRLQQIYRIVIVDGS